MNNEEPLGLDGDLDLETLLRFGREDVGDEGIVRGAEDDGGAVVIGAAAGGEEAKKSPPSLPFVVHGPSCELAGVIETG